MPKPSNRAGSRATIFEVAAAAGVSIATASRALQGSPLVRPETAERVLRAARVLHFEPNRAARTLRAGASSVIGMVLPDVAIAFYASALKGAQGVLEQAGYMVMVFSTERDAAREAAALRELRAHRVAGLLVATTGGWSEEEDVDTPVVFLDQGVPDQGQGYVGLANQEGMRLLVDHLVSHDHRRIAYVGPADDPAPGIAHGSATERRRGFLDAMAVVGLEVPHEYLASTDLLWTGKSAEIAVKELLALAEPPTAIVAAGDTLAMGALRALHQTGHRVPDDIALVAFDDPLFADVAHPTMTALSRHDMEIGSLAASLLLDNLRGARSRTGAALPPDVRISPRLVVRASCGCDSASASAAPALAAVT